MSSPRQRDSACRVSRRQGRILRRAGFAAAPGAAGQVRWIGLLPEQPALALVIEPEPPDDPAELITLQTSTGESAEYHRAAVVRFEVEGEPASLTVFREQYSGQLFLPFADATSGTETYGAGRYLEVQPLDDGRLLIDFNYAYNPYCAYNDAWSCPLPPPENRLTVSIRAGERRFVETGQEHPSSDHARPTGF